MIKSESDEFLLGWALGDGVDTPLGLGIVKRIASHYTCDVLIGDKIVNIPEKEMTVVARGERIRMASLDNIGFGPDKLPYKEALEREYAKQPALPGSTKIEQNNSAAGVSPRRKGRYDGSLQQHRTSSVIKEGTMPRKSAAPAVEEPEETEEVAKDLRVFATKKITPVAQALAEWLVDNVALELDEEEMELFTRAVYLTNALRRESRLDPANRERTEALAEERRAARKPAKADEDEDEDEGEEEAPAKPARGRKPAVTSSTTTSSDGKAPARRGRASSTAAPKPTAPRGRAKAGAAAPF